MELPFFKFDGAGNDFVVVDNRLGGLSLGPDEIARLCHRRFGIGADGLMSLDAAPEGYAFEMRYYNSDGLPGTMCGNGGRCIATLAFLLGLGERSRFRACDGDHQATILRWDPAQRRGLVELTMRDVPLGDLRRFEGGTFLDTGSPHFVVETSRAVDSLDVVALGRALRQRADLFPEGANIDFVQRLADGSATMRTYERGVEDETWACGTGVTAVALVTGCRSLLTRGGRFRVDFDATPGAYTHIRLTGPVSLNFTGTWTFSQA